MECKKFEVTFNCDLIDDPFAPRFRWLDWRNINVRRAYQRWKWDRAVGRYVDQAAKELADKIDRIIMQEVINGNDF